MPTIALLGGECTGKSVLAESLGSALDGVVVPELLRVFVERNLRPPLLGEQYSLFEAQRGAIRAAERDNPDRWVICDPAAAMTAIYSQIYFDDHALIARAQVELGRVKAIVWCDIDLPWEPDGLHRDGPEMRAAAHEAIEAFLAATPGLEVIRVSGSVEARTDAIVELLVR